MSEEILPLSFALGRYETATSYASRLARYCGLGAPSDLCLDLGFRWQDLIRGDEALYTRLAAVGGVCAADLAHWAVRTVAGNRFRVSGQLGSRKTLLRTRVRLCPRCVVSDWEQGGRFGPWRRHFWQIVSLRRCARHGTPLIMLPAEQYTVHCYDYLGQVEKHAALIRDAAATTEDGCATDLDRYIIARLEGHLQNAFLDSYPMFIATTLCERLGFVLRFGAARKITSASEAELSEAGQAGFESLQGGQAGFERALDRLVSDQALCTARHQADLGALFEWLRNAALGDEFTPLKDLVRAFIWRSYPVQPGMTVLGQSSDCPRIHTITTARKALGIQRKRMNRYLLDQGLARHDPDRNRVVLVRKLTAADVDGIQRKITQRLSRAEASRLLGVSADILVALRQRGLIEAKANALDGLNQYEYADLADLAENVKARATPGHRQKPGMASILDVSRTLHCPFAEVLALILDGRLQRIEYVDGARGLGAIRVSVAEARAVVQAGTLRGVTKGTAQRLLRVTYCTVTHLAVTGHLEMLGERSPRSGHLLRTVDKDSLTRFLDEYETLGWLAHRLKRKPGPLGCHMRANGIIPVNASAGVSWYYPRKGLKDRMREIGIGV